MTRATTNRVVPYLLIGLLALGGVIGAVLGSMAGRAAPRSIGYGVAPVATDLRPDGTARSTPSTPVPTRSCPPSPTTTITCTPLPTNSWFGGIAVTNGAPLLTGWVSSDPGAPGTCVQATVDPDTLQLGDTDQGLCDDPAISGEAVAAVSTYLPDSNNATLAIARVDPQTGQVSIGPVLMTYGSYSDSHPVMAYGGGSLWIYDVETTEGPQAIQVSASSGEVEDTVAMPHLYKPILAANDDGLWIGNSVQGGECAGCGPPSALYHVSPGSDGATVVVPDSTSVVCWLLGDGDHLWVGMGRESTGCGTLTIWRFDGTDTQPVFEVPDQGFDPLTVVGGATDGLWAVVPFPPTVRIPSGPYAQDVVRIDPDTGQETVVASLPPILLPVNYLDPGTQLTAYVDGSLFLLEPPFQSNGSGYGALVRVNVSG